jgi:hypothetical protein
VAQPYITINDYNGKRAVFSKPGSNAAKKLLEHTTLQDGIGWGWKGYLKDRLIKPDEDKGTFDDVDDLKKALAIAYPPPSEKKKEKSEKKKAIKRVHQENLDKIDPKKVPPGKRIRTVSYKGSTRYNNAFFQTQTHQTNVTNLETNFHTTDKGQVHDLTVNNPFQSVFALYGANFPNNAKGAMLDDVWHPMRGGALGPPPTFRTVPFTEVEDRLKLTVANDDGAYQIGEPSNSTALRSLELTRFPENVIPTVMRGQMVTGNLLTQNYEHDPTGQYALYEMPNATKGLSGENSLMDQNTYNIYQQTITLPQNTVLGFNPHLLPQNTPLSTIGSFQTALTNYISDPKKETQNALTREGFRVQRANVGHYVQTPPGSPYTPNLY